ncbi:MAG: hypothetical protein IT410_04060 [Candidatus Doudnabacteria bacterium]|nr:hypothetical protein [Candidatus Doudnabacteria bacterium]
MPRQQVKDMYIVLKDFEPMVKDPRFLRNGRPIPNFSVLPREAWANWLLCVVLRDFFQHDITFAEDDETDGVIYDKDTNQWFFTEHVCALQTPGPHASLKGEDRVMYAIQHKIDRGVDYARGKRLVVFIEDAGEWFPNRVGRSIHGTHSFDAVYCIGISSLTDDGYTYFVTQLDHQNSPAWKVFINMDFTDWQVIRLQ